MNRPPVTQVPPWGQCSRVGLFTILGPSLLGAYLLKVHNLGQEGWGGSWSWSLVLHLLIPQIAHF